MEDHNPLSRFSFKILLDGQLINYYKVGNGPRHVFICPAFLVPMQYNFVSFLNKMDEHKSSDYTILCWDRPGYFGSKPPRRNLEDIHLDYDVVMCERFLRALGVSKVIMMGFSAGAQEAILFTLKYPQLVDKLLIWSAVDLMDSDDLAHHDKISSPKYQIGPKLAYVYNDFGENRKECLEHIYAWHAYIRKALSGKDPDEWNKRYESITCPTLIIYGDKDNQAAPKFSKAIHENIKGSRIELLRGGRHDLHNLDPSAEPFYNLTCDFLSL